MKSAEIRKRFLDYFAERGHQVVASSNLVPDNDPTLYFANAGMVQFKHAFTGQETRPYSRAASSQKCLRVSGKHNDLEEVGRTPRHHTLFEMLGNFSFGDYFKRDAIAMAWELLTSEGGFNLDVDRLWVTVFEEDDEAERIWIDEVGVPAERVQRLGAKENFWSMGDTGPCGPCSEIHWDRGPAFGQDGGPAVDDDRFMEIWNLVFMQFEQRADGSRIDLPNPSIDTGMGLERLAAVLQGASSNYDTDVFQPLIQRAAELAGVTYGDDPESDVALRVIADHARATAFLIADGVIPDRGGRGYVLRRIMRRAIRFGVKIGLNEPFLFKIADAVIAQMLPAYPYLAERRGLVEKLVQIEEIRFLGTLEQGLKLLDGELAGLPEGGELPGVAAFKLYDTYGFPLDLTRLICDERGYTIDEAGFDGEMAKQRKKGQDNWKGSGAAGIGGAHAALAATLQPTVFNGYDRDEHGSQVVGLVREGEVVTSLATGESGEVLVAETPFYAESGGQVGDTGEIHLAGGGVFTVTDVQKGPGELFLHTGRVANGSVSLDEGATMRVDGAKRDLTRLNHTATHLLHSALREVLGDHVGQKGSLVTPDRLRFDFSHYEPVTPAELEAIEQRVLGQLDGNREVGTAEMSLEEAKKSGAIAMFGEKYGDEVRVVSVGDFSVEFCGGTHARRTGDIGIFKITGESGVAAGVRRIEALTGPGARSWLWTRDAAAREAAARLRTPVEQLPAAIDKIQQSRKQLEKEIERLKQELARAAGDPTSQLREVDGLKVIAAEIPGDARTLRSEADRLRDQIGSGLVVLGSREGGRVLLVAAATADVAGSRVHAGNIIREIAGLVGGRGGGRPNMAQAGGQDPDGLPAALEKVYELV